MTTAAGLSTSVLVRVTTRIAAGGVPTANFGRGLIVTQDSGISASGSGKVRLFSNIGEVNAALNDGSALDAAKVWFGANPVPKSLYIGRWASVDVSTTIGSNPMGTIGAVGAAPLNSATASFRINETNVVGIDLSGVGITTYAAIATAIGTALATAITGATIAHASDTGFVITLASATPISPPYLENAVNAAGVQVGTDISGALAMAQSNSPVYRAGHDAESITDAVGEMQGLASGEPVAVMLAADAPLTVGGVDTRESLAALAQADGGFVFGLLDTADQALVTGDTTSHLALAFSRSQDKVAGMYSKAGPKPEVGLLAEMSGQNLDLPASIITPNAKPLPGVEATFITTTQLAELTRKRANVLTVVGGLPSLLEGYTSRGGYWLDAVWWLLWLQRKMELNIWNAQRASRRFNSAILLNTLHETMQGAIRNGGIQPGNQLTAETTADVAQTTGNLEFDGTLPGGYTAWVDPRPTALDRENRLSFFKVWMAGSDATHRVLGDLVFTN